MSNPSIPNITPLISISTAQTVPLLLASIALEELGLAHIVNAEAEKLQFVLGTLTPTTTTFSPALTNLLTVDTSVQRTLRDVIKKEMLLEFAFENVLDLIGTIVTVTLTADPTAIAEPGCLTAPTSSTLTGQVLVGGSPPPAGTLVFFTQDPAGTLTPNLAMTDASGVFTAMFTAAPGVAVPTSVMITATALGQNSNPVTIAILPCPIAAFSITKSGPTAVPPGGFTQYNIILANTGPVPLTNLTVTDTIPAGTTFSDGISFPAGWSGSESGGVVTFTAPSPFATGSSALLQFDVVAPATPGTTFMNTATANSTETGPVTSNTTITVVTPIFLVSRKFFSKVSAGTVSGSDLQIPASFFVDDNGNPITDFPTTFNYFNLFINGMIQENGVAFVTPSQLTIKGGSVLDTDDPIALAFIISV